jgi:prepilin-type N-terminal cleavage/methylation domain-containing protein
MRLSSVGRSARRGFTLVELIVVIAIMAVLASFIVGAIQRVRVSETVRVSESIVGKCQDAVEHQLDAIHKGAYQEKRSGSAEFRTLLTFCNGDEDRALALLTYCRVKQAFPQSAGELTTTMTAPPLVGQFGFTLGGANFPRSPAFASLQGITGNADEVSGALLHRALTKRTLLGYTFPAAEGVGQAEVDVTIGGVDHRVFVDGWKRPVAFRRFYYSNATDNRHATWELNQPPFINPRDISKDPFDPKGRLDVPVATWSGRTASEAVLNAGHLGPNPFVFSNAYNKRLIVFSAGQNEQYDNFTPDVNWRFDDILGYRLSSIGRRGTQ